MPIVSPSLSPTAECEIKPFPSSYRLYPQYHVACETQQINTIRCTSAYEFLCIGSFADILSILPADNLGSCVSYHVCYSLFPGTIEDYTSPVIRLHSMPRGYNIAPAKHCHCSEAYSNSSLHTPLQPNGARKDSHPSPSSRPRSRKRHNIASSRESRAQPARLQTRTAS